MKKVFVGFIVSLFAVFAAANQAPVISSMNANPGAPTGKTSVLKVIATDDGGESNLTYSWTATVTPAASATATFSANNSNAAKTTTVTVNMAGFYLFQVLVKDKGNPVMSATSGVSIYVLQTETTLNVWPPTITTSPAVPRKFTSTIRDQFGNRFIYQPSATWSISSGAWIQADGTVFTNTAAGTWTVTGKYTNSLGTTIQGTATITVAIPSVTTARQYIKNVFIIMQENRSFDNYFGKYQGANGFARIDFTPVHHHSSGTENEYPHVNSTANAELASSNWDPSGTYLLPDAFKAQNGVSDYNNDCFGYHNGDAGDLCNYWAMADTFVLQDALFESCKSYSKPSHCYMVSGWSAGSCNSGQSPICLSTDVGDPNAPSEVGGKFLWNSIASQLPAGSWKYYKLLNFNSGCANCDASCFTSGALTQNDYWLPMPKFTDAKGQADVDVADLVTNLASNPANVPKVCWIVPGMQMSEHPQGQDVRKGQKYVTSLVKAIMSSSLWNNCAIFISWDDWGGHYDHAIPPYVTSDNMQGWGLRVPGLMLSPYAKKATGTKKGWVDHEQYSHDAYLRLIEDLFCNGNRISNGDGRPLQTETMVEQGNLLNEFDFTQTARTSTAFKSKLVCQQTF